MISSCDSLLSFNAFSVSVLQNLTQHFIWLRIILVVFLDKSSPKAFWSDAAVALWSNFDERQTEGKKVNNSACFLSAIRSCKLTINVSMTGTPIALW